MLKGKNKEKENYEEEVVRRFQSERKVLMSYGYNSKIKKKLSCMVRCTLYET